MKRIETFRPPHDERGVALLIALAVLVLMAILAVSFYTSQSLESGAAENARYARSAEGIAQGGLEWALVLLQKDAQDYTPSYDTNFDIWGPRAKDHSPHYQDADKLLFSTSGSPNEVNLSLLDDNPTPTDDARWITVNDGLRAIGRFAVMVEDECGKANINVVGNTSGPGHTQGQSDGISPSEISLAAILEAVDSSLDSQKANNVAKEIIDLRNGPDKAPGMGGSKGDDDHDGPLGYPACDDDADGITDEPNESINEPDERNVYDPAADDLVLLDLSTIRMAKYFGDLYDADKNLYRKLLAYLCVNSRTQNVYKLEPANGSVTDDWAEQVSINRASFQDIHTVLQRLQGAGRLPSDADLDQITANIVDFIDKDSTPTQTGNSKHGIEKTPYINEVEAAPPDYQQATRHYYDHGEFIELINPYDVEVTVTIDTYMQTSTGGRQHQVIPVKVPARISKTEPRFYVIGDTSGYYEYTDPDGNVQRVYFDDPNNRKPSRCQQYANLCLEDGGGSMLVIAPGGGLIETAEYKSAGGPGRNTSQKDDPRVNTADNWDSQTETLGKQNANWDPGASGDKDNTDDLTVLFPVYNDKLGSVGELGRVHTGKPWATIDLTGDDLAGNWDNVHTSPSWLNIYDVFTTAEGNLSAQPRYGLINVNTAPEQVLRGLKGVDAARLANDVKNGRIFETAAEIGAYVDMTKGATSSEREHNLADVVNLVTVRSNVFRVIVLAQAVDRQGHKTAERRLEASVMRTVNPGTGEMKVRVLSMRWVPEE